HMSESEKERFVTYYFRGMNENTYEGEDVLITPSPKVPTYDRKPEMSFPEQVKNFKKQLSKDQYHFFVMNAANADMVAHSGNLQSTILGCEAVDRGLTEIADAILSANGT